MVMLYSTILNRLPCSTREAKQGLKYQVIGKSLITTVSAKKSPQYTEWSITDREMSVLCLRKLHPAVVQWLDDF